MKVVTHDEVTDFDKYHAAIIYLTAHPEEIEEAWASLRQKIGGCLFQFAMRDGFYGSNQSDPNSCGCLTQVKNKERRAETEALTTAIRNDVRIPSTHGAITVRNLHVFAEWQRRLDKELNRKIS